MHRKLCNQCVDGLYTLDALWVANLLLWQVNLQFGQTHICVGSLISECWVRALGTDSSTLRQFVFLYSVRLGSIDVNHSSKDKEYYVSKIITYPSHYGITRDIALLKLSSTVTFTALILPICFPSLYPSTLQEAEVPLISNEGCKQLYSPIGIFLPELESIIEEDELCAGDIQTKDSCKADSGGPLSCHIDGVWVLMGVVSWGLECGKSPPGVYVNVTYYPNWIKAIISRARGSGGDCTYVISCSLLYFFLWLSWDPPEP
ncbi:hypothetical protein U0070_016196 [Myodes glareolus]|uniref:Peptidase S1 domain-containing protein n=1 Tax=Myodes glareolus TaxID=447135 RepID=A0AAW0HFL4_MYOGA